MKSKQNTRKYIRLVIIIIILLWERSDIKKVRNDVQT